jgi:hypothetical protein
VTRNLQFLSGRNLVPLVTGNLNTHFPSFHPDIHPRAKLRSCISSSSAMTPLTPSGSRLRNRALVFYPCRSSPYRYRARAFPSLRVQYSESCLYRHRTSPGTSKRMKSSPLCWSCFRSAELISVYQGVELGHRRTQQSPPLRFKHSSERSLMPQRGSGCCLYSAFTLFACPN